MTGRSEPTPPTAGPGANAPCDAGVQPCPYKCWTDDYEKEISVTSYGRYFKKYKSDGAEYSYTFSKKYKILVPVKTGTKITVQVRFKDEVLEVEEAGRPGLEALGVERLAAVAQVVADDASQVQPALGAAAHPPGAPLGQFPVHVGDGPLGLGPAGCPHHAPAIAGQVTPKEVLKALVIVHHQERSQRGLAPRRHHRARTVAARQGR